VNAIEFYFLFARILGQFFGQAEQMITGARFDI